MIHKLIYHTYNPIFVVDELFYIFQQIVHLGGVCHFCLLFSRRQFLYLHFLRVAI